MRVAANSNTTNMVRRIISAFKVNNTVSLEAIGGQALEKAIHSIEKVQEWKKENHPIEIRREVVEFEDKKKTIHKIEIFK